MYGIVQSIASYTYRDTVDEIIPPPPPPRAYYVSDGGSGDGLTSGAPADYSILDSAEINPGDSIYFNKGDTFEFGEFSYNVGNVTVTSFGTGADPILTGSEAVTGWTDETDGTWSKTISEPKWVFINGTEAKMAESDWIPITLVVSSTVRRVTAATINALPDSIVGAYLTHKEFTFRLSNQLTVSAYDSGNGNITITGGGFSGGAVGMPIKLSNQIQFMVDEGDWAYVGGKLYIKSVSEPTNVRVVTKDYGIFANNAGTTSITGIQFQHYFKYGVLASSCDNLTVQDNSFLDIRGTGLRVNGPSTFGNVLDNTVSRCGLNGIEISGIKTGEISGNIINEIGENGNLGRPFDACKTGGCGITILTFDPLGPFSPDDLTIENNTIHDVGYQGILLWGKRHIVQYNHVYNYCSKWSDGGGIYYYYGNNLGLNNPTSDCVTQFNVIHDGIGNTDGITSGAVDNYAAIYHDSGIENCEASNNFIFDPGKYGIFVNAWNTQHIFQDNIILGATDAQIRFILSASVSAVYDFTLAEDCIVTGNTLIFRDNNTRGIILSGAGDIFGSMFTTLDNNHYVNPYSTRLNAKTSESQTGYTNYTLSQWQTYISDDASATQYSNYKASVSAGDATPVYNVTGSNVDENIPAGNTTITGSAPSNPYTLVPFTGLVYLDEP